MTDSEHIVLFLDVEKPGRSSVTLNSTTGCAIRKMLFPLNHAKPGLNDDGAGERTLFCMNQIANTSGLILAEHFTHALDADRIPYAKLRIIMSPDLLKRPDYWIDVNPIDDRAFNQTFNVTGSTNLPVGTKINYDSYRSYFCPGGGCPYAGPSGTAIVTGEQNGNHSFSILLSGAAFKPDDEYAITIESPDKEISAIQVFRPLPL